MPGETKADKQHSGFSRRQLWIVGITTLGAILTAAAPGFMTWRADAGRVREIEAALAQADRADVKTELTYELIKQKVDLMEKQIAETRADIRELRSMNERLLVERALAVRSNARSGLAGISGIGVGGGGAGVAPTTPVSPVVAQEQAELPSPGTLEKLVDKRMKARAR